MGAEHRAPRGDNALRQRHPECFTLGTLNPYGNVGSSAQHAQRLQHIAFAHAVVADKAIQAAQVHLRLLDGFETVDVECADHANVFGVLRFTPGGFCP
ncbi:MAG: hypothetical protein Q8M33_17420 [Hydrogenophaga sp.]|nr:hypothetical protein [Hydrogenophaga sp.]